MRDTFRFIVIFIITLEARLLLWRKKPHIIAITGNVGKTSTKDTIYAVIKKKVHARKSEKSYNSDIGIALTVLGIPNAWSNPVRWFWNILEGLAIALFTRSYPTWLVLETGVDRPGDMSRITKWIKPDIIVLTRFPDVPVHVEYFRNPEEVAKEKMKLVDALKPGGTIVYNHDDERIRREIESVQHTSIGFSRRAHSEFTASRDIVTYRDSFPIGITFTVTHGSETAKVVVLGSLGTQHTYSYTAAIAVGSLLNIPLEEAAGALREHVPAPGRLRIIPGIKETTLLDDTYNAAPTAVIQALTTLAEVRGKQKIAVLGDMLELGRYSTEEHKKIGAFAAGHVDILITVGVRARAIAESAIEAGLSAKQILQFEDAGKAGKALEAVIGRGDIILAKGAQNMRMERVIEELMAEPERAEELLVRQDQFWKE